jgi:hypothetical protein
MYTPELVAIFTLYLGPGLAFITLEQAMVNGFHGNQESGKREPDY